MPCLNCYDPKKAIFTRGLCQACYHRLRRSGSVQRKNAVNQGQECSIEGCSDRAWAKGLCSKHYLQDEHPLKATWRNLRTKAIAAGDTYPKTWGEFATFLEDVGTKPSRKHQLRRRDPRRPYSKENCHWIAPVKEGTTPAEYVRNWTLKAHFGLEPHEYEEMASAQNDCCAICKRPEVQVNSRAGVVQRLSVDHDHKTNAVRELLCFRCNALLGSVDDSSNLLRAAADYLDRHKRTQEVPE